MMTNELKTDLETIAIDPLPVGCLSGATFRIPKYQRGYRWKKDDVTKLLEDLEEFIKKAEAAEDEPEDEAKAVRSFYCLQPLVVTKSEENPSDWEVVDGQQRLTTLFLIWNVINGKAPYELSYVTRERSKGFLSGIAGKTPKDITNIDFHHIYHAHRTIQEWFKGENEEEKKKQFLDLFENADPSDRNIRFIWYRLVEDDDAVAAFTRLNVGKIPLTDEELIRALFLRSTGSDKLADGAFQHRLALEWDRIEIALQEPDFWGFLSNKTPPEGGRIRLLFQLCAVENLKDDNHALFEHYHDRLAGKHPQKPSSVWHDIVACFEQLEEWYRDPELFHLVGYLATILNHKEKPIKILRGLLKEAKESNKSGFAAHLRTEIRKLLIGDGKETADFVGELDYLQNSGPIRPALAIFNIATILRTKGVRILFPFHLYHGNKWDIEHVHSQGGQNLSKESNQKEWLGSLFDEIRREDKQNELLHDVNAFLESQPDAPAFNILYKRIGKLFGEDGDTNGVHGIGNLTLLDQSTNRGYGNDPFVLKRAKILKAERDGIFILPCSRDLFLKVFSENAGDLRRWDIENDGDAHEKAICKVLETFFGEVEGSRA